MLGEESEKLQQEGRLQVRQEEVLQWEVGQEQLHQLEDWEEQQGHELLLKHLEGEQQVQQLDHLN